jgi:hypothetical protein
MTSASGLAALAAAWTCASSSCSSAMPQRPDAVVSPCPLGVWAVKSILSPSASSPCAESMAVTLSASNRAAPGWPG